MLDVVVSSGVVVVVVAEGVVVVVVVPAAVVVELVSAAVVVEVVTISPVPSSHRDPGTWQPNWVKRGPIDHTTSMITD